MSPDYSMETIGNVQYFVYEHSASYKEIQHKFLQAVESLNPENIIVSEHTVRLDFVLFNFGIVPLIVFCHIIYDISLYIR